MSDEIRINRSAAAGNNPSPKPEVQTQSPEPMQGASRMPWMVLAVIVVVLVIVGFLFRDKLMGKKAGAPAGSSTYQAVFLTNGQVYFGKLSETEKDYLTLKDIYYLQVVQPPLQGSGQSAQPAQPQASPQISLVKLGNELHGPVDEMHISRPQVLFFEDLKSDGQVVQAIEKYKANPSGQ